MAGILDLFIPKEKKFFEYLDQQIALLDQASVILDKLIKTEGTSKEKLHKDVLSLHKKSDEVDRISREMVNHLHKTFITPIDREEIKTLSTHLGFIVDALEKIGSTIYLFKIKNPDKKFLQQIKILLQSIRLLKYIFEEPLSPKRNKETIEKIKELEREADAVYRTAMGELFSNGKNPIEIIKRKELYDITEDTIDDICHVTDLLETIIINNS
jgi:predicted phosphate transport protein (TIGR00153 family)